MSDSFDFPAAHSMDTTWFAIDRDGHVALFESGEAGAVPAVVAEEGVGGAELFEGNGDAVIYDLAGFAATKERPHVDERIFKIVARTGALLAFLRDTPEVRARLDERVIVRSTEGVACRWTGQIDRELFAWLHSEDACLGCYLHFDEPAHGAYLFHHTCENWISGPYARITSPETPAHVDDLSAEVLEHAIRFDGRFAETTTLQPAEKWACESWMPGWLATDKKTVRPFAGREDELDEVRSNLDGQDGLVIAAPIAGLPDAERLVPAAAKSKPKYEDLVIEESEPDVAGSATPAKEAATKVTSPAKDETAAKGDVSPAKKPWWKLW